MRLPLAALYYCVFKNEVSLYDAGVDTYLADGFTHGPEEVEASVFYGAAALVVDDERTLLGLLGCVLTDFDECIDYVLERVEIVIKDHQVHEVGGFNGFEHICLFLFLVCGFHGEYF